MWKSLVVALAMTVCLVGSGCQSPEPESTSEAHRPAPVPSDGEAVLVGPGRDVTIETPAGTLVDFSGAFDSDQEIRVHDGDGDSLSVPSPHAALIGTPVVVDLADEPVAPVEVTFAVTAGVEERPPIVASNASGSWEVVLGSYVAETSTVRAKVPHFDWWAPWDWCWSCVFDSASQQVGRLLGNRAGPPDCDQPEPDWVRDAFTDSASSAALVGCVTTNGDKLEIRLVNNRSYGLIVTSPVPFDYVALDSPLPLNDVARSGLGADRFERLTANYLGSETDGATVDWLFLPPTSAAFIGIDRPATALFALTAQRTGETVMLDVAVALMDAALNDVAASSLVEGLLLLMGRCQLIPWATMGPPTEPAELVDWLRLLAGCAAEAIEEAAQPPIDPTLYSGDQLVQVRNLKELLAAIDVFEFAGKMADNLVDAIVDEIALPRYTVLTAPLLPDTPGSTLPGCPTELSDSVDEAVHFVCQILAGGEVGSLLATMELTGPEESELAPFDREALIQRFGEIEAFAGEVNAVRASPDAHVNASDPTLAPSCDFSHGLWCEVDLLDDGGGAVASIEVQWYGDGITNFEVVWQRAQQPTDDVARLQAEWMELQATCRGGPGDDPATLEACDEWTVVGDELTDLGWCHGRRDPDSIATEWFRCNG